MLITIGKHIVNPSTNGEVIDYPIESNHMGVLSSVTMKNVLEFSVKIGVMPYLMQVEQPRNARKSYYIWFDVKGRQVLYARRETENIMAGQTKVYSVSKVVQYLYLKGASKQQVFKILDI